VVTSTWDARWPERIRSLIRDLGHANAYSYIIDNPDKNFGQLFQALRDRAGNEGFSIAYVQLEQAYYRDAAGGGHLREALMEALIRVLRQYMHCGWGQTVRDRSRRLTALANWPVPSEDIDRWHHLRDTIWRELEAANPPVDWCPRSREDPLIRDVFERAWPLDSSSASTPWPHQDT
jgi:hypothetical protein